MTLPKSQMANSGNSEDKWTSSVGAFLAKPFLSQADDWDLRTLEALSSLSLLDVPRKFNHLIYFLRTSRGYSVTTRDGRTPQSSIRWMNWGIMSNGKCLTVKISAFPKTGSGSFLSDILESEVSDQYFLSEDKVAQLILTD